jgi:exosortase D (VPLPA-CTERM-specific)
VNVVSPIESVCPTNVASSQRQTIVRVCVLAIVAIIILAVGFRGGLTELYHRWSTQEEYSHGFIIPLITLWLLWTRRQALVANLGAPSWLGALLIIAAVTMLIIGEVSAVFILSQLGFVVSLFGIVLALGGYSLLRVTVVPIAFLLFAIPLPYFIDSMLTLRLQLISSELGVWFIRLFDIPVYLDGNIIDMGTYKLQVVDACSGLRYLYPLLSLSFLAAYLFQAPFWQRLVVFLSSIPIAIGMNGIRIGLVGILVANWGNQMAEGALHFFEGWVIFLACSAILALEIYLLALASRKTFFEVFYSPQPSNFPVSPSQMRVPRFGPIVACISLLCVGTISVFLYAGRAEAFPERTRFVEFPQRLGAWTGHPGMLDLETEKGLGLDDYILSDYTQPEGKVVNLYVAYYSSQRKGESPHSPVVCIPGSGWAITDLSERNYSGQPLNRVIIQKGNTKQIVYYWFDERGRKITNEWAAKLYLLTDAIWMNRTDGALVRLTTAVLPNEVESDADQRLQTFMTDASPRLAEFLPSAKINQAGSLDNVRTSKKS